MLAASADPIRILQAIIIAVSFLAAGTIFRGQSPDDVQGLTAAASLLAASRVGIAVALRQWYLAIGVTVLVAVVLRTVHRLEEHLRRRL
jgi:putative Mg2+ transporter-C (MgtC) family protein